MFRLAVFAGLIVYAAAQSARCKAALGSIAANNDANKCLALNDLYTVAMTPANTSIVKPLNAWLVTMCAAPACSNATLAAVVTNLTTGCSIDFNISSDATSLIPIVQSYYPPIRKILCLKHGSTLCVTETLTNVETITGPLTPDNIKKIYEKPPTSLPANITCTDCGKASYNIWAKCFPSDVATAKAALKTQCGPSFVDGSNPSSIT